MKKIGAGLLIILFLVSFLTATVNAIDMPLGDRGKPSDYEETIVRFNQTIDNFTAFVDQFPAAFNWKDRGAVTEAKDQGFCGSCWAFACIGVLESKIRINGGSLYDLSEQQQISCNHAPSIDGCCGGTMEALKFWYNKGPMEENCTYYPDYTTFCSFNSDISCDELDNCTILPYMARGYYTVDTTNIDEMKTSLYNDGPAYFRFDVYEDFSTFWHNTNGAVYIQNNNTKYGGHAVLLIGWDDNKNAWLCKNSWGEESGPNNDGTFWIAYTGHKNNLNFGMANVDYLLFGVDNFSQYAGDASLKNIWKSKEDACPPFLSTDGPNSPYDKCMGVYLNWNNHTSSYGTVGRTYDTPLDLKNADVLNFFVKVEDTSKIKNIVVKLRKFPEGTFCSRVLPTSQLVNGVWKKVSLPKESFDDPTWEKIDLINFRLIEYSPEMSNTTKVFFDDISVLFENIL